MLPLLFALLIVQTFAYSVTVQVRNEFNEALTYKSASLIGTWVTRPPQSIAAGTTYETVWKAEGSTGVQGKVVYTAGGGHAVVIFDFINTAGNQTASLSVTPPPWIGGLGSKSGDETDVTFQYWTHKMCMTSKQCHL